MPNLKWTLLLGFAGMLVVATRQPAPRPADMARLSGDVWVAAQRTPDQLAGLRSQAFRAVIDLRPDGEVDGQPSSSEMAAAAQATGLTFSYVLIPRGDIPPASVSSLARLARNV
jgi:sulfide:quinone oxidoreductase